MLEVCTSEREVCISERDALNYIQLTCLCSCKVRSHHTHTYTHIHVHTHTHILTHIHTHTPIHTPRSCRGSAAEGMQLRRGAGAAKTRRAQGTYSVGTCVCACVYVCASE